MFTIGTVVAVAIGLYCVLEFAVKPLERRIKALEDRARD
jgi:hypothetical protein